MVKIVLIRPGATDYDEQRRIQGNLDVPLNAQGASEVNRVIEALRPMGLEMIYASTCQPALETAEVIAAALDVRMKKLNRMHNLDHGLWQGMLIDEVRRRQPKVYRQWQERPHSVCPPEGEMLDEADRRVRATMAKVLKRHKEGVIGLVVPEPLASLVRRFVSRGEVGDLWKAFDDHGRWEVLEAEPTVLTHSG